MYLYFLVYLYVGELSPERRAREDEESYYILWKEVGVVDQLSEYSSNNTLTESVLIGKLTYLKL